MAAPQAPTPATEPTFDAQFVQDQLQAELTASPNTIQEHTAAAGRINTPAAIKRRAKGFFKAFEIVVKRTSGLKDIDLGNLRREVLDKTLDAITHAQTNADMIAQEHALKNRLVLALANETAINTVLADKLIVEADSLANTQTRPIDFTQYEGAKKDATLLVEVPRYNMTSRVINEYLQFAQAVEGHAAYPLWASDWIRSQQAKGTDTQLKQELAERVRAAEQAGDKVAGKGNVNDPKYQEAFARTLGTLPCLRRSFPGQTNFSQHSAYYRTADGKNFAAPPVLRAATPAPFHIKNQKEQDRILQLNIEQFIANCPPGGPYLITSLVAPIGIGPLGNRDKKIVDSIKRVVDQMNKGRLGSEKIIYTNHPINHPILRALSRDSADEKQASKDILQLGALPRLASINCTGDMNPGYSLKETMIQGLSAWMAKPNEKNYQEFDRAAQALYLQLKTEAETKLAALDKQPVDHTTAQKRKEILDDLLLVNAVKDYVELLHKDPRMSADHNPNMFKTVLEQIIVPNCISGCVSGKDRQGMLLIQRDSMLGEFYTRGDHLLASYYDSATQRQQFVDRFTDNLVSNHEGYNANYNADGAEAQKNLTHILSKDQKAQTNEKAPTFLADSKALSSLNAQSHKYVAPTSDDPLLNCPRVAASISPPPSDIHGSSMEITATMGAASGLSPDATVKVVEAAQTAAHAAEEAARAARQAEHAAEQAEQAAEVAQQSAASIRDNARGDDSTPTPTSHGTSPGQ